MALLEFRSKAEGGFFMMPETFKAVCEVIEYPYATEGCWLPEDLPARLQRLDEEIEREKLWFAEQEKKQAQRFKRSSLPLSYEQEDELEEEERKKAERVRFAARVFPLRQMMAAAIRKNEKVMWGVPY